MLPSSTSTPVSLKPRQGLGARAASPHHRARSYPAAGLAIASAMLLPGCASTSPASVPGGAPAHIATQWHAPLPHGGQVEDLHQWWARFDDPLLLRLIAAGQAVSPTVAQAAARIATARAVGVGQQAALLPALEAGISASRGRSELGVPTGILASTGLQLGWELDLFGAGRAAADAAQARLESSEAGWHDARITVAAEVATSYVALRACEARVEQAEMDARSRGRTVQITRLAVAAGVQPAVAAALAEANAAQGTLTLLQQRAHCELLIKALNALTAEGESALRRELAAGTGVLPRPTELGVTAMPAEILAQRPDIHAAARELIAASAESDLARAQRWPRIALAGSIGAARTDSLGISTHGAIWSMGPVTVTLPLFDGGARRANAEAAHVRHESASTVYLARLREAIRDVENALVTLDSTGARSTQARNAAAGFERAYDATAASYRAGMASLFELEDARRSMLAAQMAVTDLHRDRLLAWIALYRAMGGGWSPSDVGRAHHDAARG